MPRINRITEAEVDLRTFFNPEGELMSPQQSEDAFLFTLPLNVFSPLKRTEQHTIGGAAGVLTVSDVIVPADTYWYVICCALKHSDVVNQSLSIGINFPPTALNTALVTGVQIPNLGLAVPRAFIVPPGLQMKGETIALGAGANLELRLVLVAFKLAEICPQL